MNLITCPDHIDDNYDFEHNWAFLAGGITNCPDWQAEAIQKLSGEKDLLLMNPRRASFDVTNPAEEAFQIRWEADHIEVAHIMLFWFPEETLCPITLFELGKCLGIGSQEIVVGTHPNYKRRRDVIYQTEYMDNRIKIRDNLDDVLEDLKRKMI